MTHPRVPATTQKQIFHSGTSLTNLAKIAGHLGEIISTFAADVVADGSIELGFLQFVTKLISDHTCTLPVSSNPPAPAPTPVTETSGPEPI